MSRLLNKEYRLNISGRDIPVRLRRNRLARKLILRTETSRPDSKFGVVLTLPNDISELKAFNWVKTQIHWINLQLQKSPERVVFKDGIIIPLCGVNHVVRHRPSARRGVWAEEGLINVSGQIEYLPRRLTDWLKKQARKIITERVTEKAAAANANYGRISVRDTRTRWGSCSSNGNLNFSWRLILAPHYVFDYVVAHEVAHLLEHNHGTQFWKLVDTLTDERKRASAWLVRYGSDLHRYGG
ncbi:MAG: hypothetical protein CBB68_15345 [Rhodospirillaceae bacterium TMED8]|nr:hypothetical protein [Magnetovibrio sp.]OUT47799.1 MAG: hypothetical protein CBB68_15345 [Rhodospirillaceae bacterium TMED8]